MPNLHRTIPKTMDAVIAQQRTAATMVEHLRARMEHADTTEERERLAGHIATLERMAGMT